MKEELKKEIKAMLANELKLHSNQCLFASEETIRNTIKDRVLPLVKHNERQDEKLEELMRGQEGFKHDMEDIRPKIARMYGLFFKAENGTEFLGWIIKSIIWTFAAIGTIIGTILAFKKLGE